MCLTVFTRITHSKSGMDEFQMVPLLSRPTITVRNQPELVTTRGASPRVVSALTCERSLVVRVKLKRPDTPSSTMCSISRTPVMSADSNCGNDWKRQSEHQQNNPPQLFPPATCYRALWQPVDTNPGDPVGQCWACTNSP